ncbi:MAG: type II toxin-antitoxin system VapC family toxin [Chloroflexi bacterium]|nr:type II toxin-antitoxin system VapC family toxin [Chloroflexota bacterium]
MNTIAASPPEENVPRNYVLDSFAIIGYFDDEPGSEIVGDLIRQVPKSASLFLSIINFGEIAYEAERERGDAGLQTRLAEVRSLPIAFVAADETTVLAAAHIKAKHPVSYADAFAIALAQELKATIVTGDPEFRTVEKFVDILWLREPERKRKQIEKKQAKERRATYRVKSNRERHPK